MEDTVIFEIRIASGEDDVEERSSGSVATNSSDLEMANDGARTGQTIGLRFTGVDIPVGAIITVAYIQFQVDEVSTGISTLTIEGEDTGDAAAFTKTNSNVSSRAKTAASALWEPAEWTTVGEAGVDQQTSDLTAIVQEIIDRGDWAALNDLAFIITGTGARTAEAFEGSAAGAPLLHIEYTLPDDGNANPVLDLDFNDSAAAGTGYATTFVENGVPVAIVDTDVMIADAEGDLMTRADITLTNAQAGDELTVNLVGLPDGITVNAASTATNIILSGTGTVADYQIALQQVLFSNTSETPDPTARLIDVTVNDGSGGSNTAVATIAIDLLPDAVDDVAAGLENTATVIGDVLANDDQGDAPATIVAFDGIGTSGGSIVDNGNGTFTYTPVTDFTGLDTFTYRIEDGDGDQSTATVSVTVSGAAPMVFERRIVSGSDDVEERSSGSVSSNSSDLEMADDGAKTGQTIGLRFTNIDIPDGAIITSAYIQFQTDEVSTGISMLTIEGDYSGDATAFTGARFDVSSRAKTDASAEWTPGDWTTVGAAGTDQQTTDLTAIVQEIIDRGDWAALNSLAFIISGTGKRTAEAFEGSAAGAPLLHIEYIMPDNGNANPVLDLDFNDSAAAGTGYATTFVENGVPVAIVDTDVMITDAEGDLMERATITLTNAQAGDELTVNLVGLPAGITVNAASTATNIILSGAGTVAEYQIALQQVLFSNTSETPNPTARLINIFVNDGSGNSNTAVATIAIDRAPDAVNDGAVGLVNTTTSTGDVLANDDQGDAPATIVAFDSVSTFGGSIIDNGNGTFNYTPVTDFTGLDTFTYRIEDGDGDQSTATVTVNVLAGGGGGGPATVVGIYTMWSHNIPDPAGVAYDPISNRIFISDSEVEELPIFNDEHLFAFDLSPAGLAAAPVATYNLSFTNEATGLAIDGNRNLMYITDDDASVVFVVDPANPTTVLWSFSSAAVGSDDTEDVAVDQNTGNLFIVNGTSRTIQEVSLDQGTQTATLVTSFTLSDPEIIDPEAIAYDPVHDVFLVGGGFGPNIYIVDRNGDTLLKIDLLKDFRNDHTPNGSTIRTSVKDIELAPASDGSGETHIYVADYGHSHVLDGRLIEIDPGDIFDALPVFVPLIEEPLVG